MVRQRPALTAGFSVTFLASPDESVLEESEPTFTYTLHADVTDMTGETRSAQRGVRVGYTTISAKMTAGGLAN